jgi:hypothetical protein
MGEGERAVVRVPARTLDSMLEGEAETDPRTIGLIWADIQGHEGRFFRGAGRALAHGAPVVTEFWPYAILRSGIDRDEYFEIIRGIFSRVAIIDAATGRVEPHPIETIPALFDGNLNPEQSLELILYSR